ncbi:MAG: PEPxxWA-CTERM sorting domain-containing protein [Pseudomonadota bacterium]
MRRFLLLCGVGLSAAFASMPASAQALVFNLTGSRTATFTLADSIPDRFNTSSLIGNQIFFDAVSGSFGGSPGTGNISFGTNLISPFQIQSANLGFTQFNGPTLFAGSPSNPTFLLGTFNLTSIVSGNSTLTISQAVAAVPEPSTWAMMLLGFGAIGIASRRRRATLTFRKA